MIFQHKNSISEGARELPLQTIFAVWWSFFWVYSLLSFCWEDFHSKPSHDLPIILLNSVFSTLFSFVAFVSALRSNLKQIVNIIIPLQSANIVNENEVPLFQSAKPRLSLRTTITIWWSFAWRWQALGICIYGIERFLYWSIFSMYTPPGHTANIVMLLCPGIPSQMFAIKWALKRCMHLLSNELQRNLASTNVSPTISAT